MEEHEPNPLDSGLSKINSAMIVNITLNNLWIEFFKHFRLGKYLSANNDLDCVWTILGGEKGVKDKNDEIDYLVVEKELKGSGVLQDGISTRGFSGVDGDFIKKSSKQKGVLLKKALYLRRLQNRQGKGTAYEDDEGFE